MSANPTSVCIATLGGQPQVVTLALDALLAHGEAVGEVIVVHLSERNPRYRAALAALAGEFAGDRYNGRPCRYRPLAVTQGNAPIDDLASESATGAALNTFSRLIQQLKRQDRAIHLCLSGGRRLLGMLAMSAVQIYGDHADQIWHLYSSDAVRQRTANGAELHLPAGAEVRLVRVPVLPLGQYFPWLRPPDGAAPGLEARASSIDAAERARCRQVAEQLTPSQREVLRAIGRGLTPQEAAAELKVEISTIHAHKTPIFELCRIAWDLPSDAPLDYRWLRERFRTYFES
jgi:CRISPR-associated protein Csx14